MQMPVQYSRGSQLMMMMMIRFSKKNNPASYSEGALLESKTVIYVNIT